MRRGWDCSWQCAFFAAAAVTQLTSWTCDVAAESNILSAAGRRKMLRFTRLAFGAHGLWVRLGGVVPR